MFLYSVPLYQVYSNPSSKLAAVLRRDCPILSESYWPTPWAFNCHLATILRSSLQRDAPVQYKRWVCVKGLGRWIRGGSGSV